MTSVPYDRTSLRMLTSPDVLLHPDLRAERISYYEAPIRRFPLRDTLNDKGVYHIPHLKLSLCPLIPRCASWAFLAFWSGKLFFPAIQLFVARRTINL